jgi:hypothetical protein
MPDPEVLTLNPTTGAITAEPCPLLHHTIGLDAPAAFYCRIHGRYESLADITINRHIRSSVTLRAFGRLLLAAVAPDCTTRRRLWRGFEDEYKAAVRHAPLPMRPVVSYTALTQAITRRASLRACFAAVAAYPDQLAQFSEAHPDKVSEPAGVTLDRTTGLLGIAGEPPVHIPIGETIRTNRRTYTRQPVIAPCAKHGWELVTLLPRMYSLAMRRETLRDYALSLIAAVSLTCDEFTARLSVLEETKPSSTVPSSTMAGYGPASFLTYAKLYARAILAATADYPELTAAVLEWLKP